MTYLRLFTRKENHQAGSLPCNHVLPGMRPTLRSSRGKPGKYGCIRNYLVSLQLRIRYFYAGSIRPGGLRYRSRREIVLTLSTIRDLVNKCCFHGDGLLLYPASHEITARWRVCMRKSCDRKLCDIINLI